MILCRKLEHKYIDRTIAIFSLTIYHSGKLTIAIISTTKNKTVKYKNPVIEKNN